MPLPAELCALLEAMTAAAAAEALAAAAGKAPATSAAGGTGGEDAGAAESHLDDIMYCQQLICLVLQVCVLGGRGGGSGG